MPTVILILFLTFAEQPPHPECRQISDRYDFLPGAEERLRVCSIVARRAERRGLDVPLVVELAWGESGFDLNSVNKGSGCSGVLQASPKYWCPGGKKEGCDLLEAGLDALDFLLKRYPTEEKALCHYKSGNRCTKAALKGAKSTMRRTHKLRRRIKRRAPW